MVTENFGLLIKIRVWLIFNIITYFIDYIVNKILNSFRFFACFDTLEIESLNLVIIINFSSFLKSLNIGIKIIRLDNFKGIIRKILINKACILRISFSNYCFFPNPLIF